MHSLVTDWLMRYVILLHQAQDSPYLALHLSEIDQGPDALGALCAGEGADGRCR